MIFEKQDYQQECITNIITLLQDFGTMKKISIFLWRQARARFSLT